MDDIFEDKFNFHKNNYLTVGAVLKNCIKFLPPAKPNAPQGLFIGDSRGALYVTEYKKTEPEIKVKANPDQWGNREVTCVDLTQTAKGEKIYFSLGNSVYQTERLCKYYAQIEFDIAETITNFKVLDNLAWVCSNHYLNKYEIGDDTKQRGTFDNEALITSICLSEFLGKGNPVSVIGTEDSKIKIINGKDHMFTVPVTSSPSALHCHKASGYDMSENNYIFGTMGGSHGILVMDQTAPKILWENNVDKSLSEIIAIRSFDVNSDGTNEIILVRANGELNIYSVGNTLLDTSLISRYKTNQVLTGIDIGKFRSEEETELMLSSYSGLIFSLTPQVLSNDINKRAIDKKTFVKNQKDLQIEVDLLKKMLKEKAEEYEKLSQVSSHNPIHKNPFKIHYDFTLLPKEACFQLLIKSEFPMEMIYMQSNIAIDVLEVITKDVNLNIINDLKSKFLCTFRMRESVHQLDIKIRTYESSADVLNCTIIPYNKPKTAEIVEIPIKSLSLHKKVELDEEANILYNKDKEDGVINILTIKGKFQSSEINQMLSSVIPDIPDKINKDSVVYFNKSTFLGSVLEVVIDNNMCQIKSVFLSPLIIIKEEITKEINHRKKEMEFSIQVKTLSVFKILELIDPMIENNFALETKYKIIQAFKEIDIKVRLSFLIF
jgi:hypothetical protein